MRGVSGAVGAVLFSAVSVSLRICAGLGGLTVAGKEAEVEWTVGEEACKELLGSMIKAYEWNPRLPDELTEKMLECSEGPMARNPVAFAALSAGYMSRVLESESPTRLDKASVAMRRAFELNQKTYRDELAMTLFSVGRWEEMLDLVKNHLPGPVKRQYLFGRVAFSFDFDAEEIYRNLTLWPDDGQKLRDTCKKLYLMSMIADKLGRYRDAWRHAEKANNLRMIDDPWIPGAKRKVEIEKAYLRAIRNVYLREPKPLYGLEIESWRGPVPLFITGLARSGTTLLEKMLESHRDIQSIGESTLFDRLVAPNVTCESTANPGTCKMEWSPNAWRKYMEASLSLFRDQQPGTTRTPRYLINKLPMNWRHIGTIQDIFGSKQRIIVVRRDPCNVFVSQFMSDFNPEGHYHSLSEEGLIWRLNQFEDQLSFWKSLGRFAWLEIQYEEIVEHPRRTMQTIMAFLGLNFDGKTLNPQNADRGSITLSVDQIKKPIYRNSLDRCSKYFQDFAPQVQAYFNMSRQL